MRSRLSIAILSLALGLFCGTAKMDAAPTSDEVSFRFRISKVEVDPRLNPNGENMDKLESILAGPNASRIQRIELRASSSPEGPFFLNERYAHERAEWVKSFINERYPSLPASVWQVEEVPEDWDGVAEYLRHSTEDYKAEAMQIVRSNSSNRKELLQDLYAGEAWDDLYKYAFPWLRAVKLRIVYSDTPVSGQQQEEQQQQQEEQQQQGQQGQGQQGQRPPRISGPIVSEGALAIFFERSITAVKPEFHRNILDIERIKDEVGRGANKLEIVGYASPEGTTAVNQSISKKRLDAARNYLSKQTGIPLDSISVRDAGEDWSGLAKAVESSYEGSDREEVLRILRDDSLSQDAKENSLKKLDGGRTWQSLIKDQMTDLRRVEVSCITVESEPEAPEIPEIIENEIDIPQEEVEVEEAEIEIEPTDITVGTIELPEEPVEPVGKYPRPVLGVYTNLLYDAATAFNLGLEVPLGRHLTINADAIYTDMPFYGAGNHMGLKIGELGLHYYFKDDGPGLKGWFVTANAGGGFYDLATKAKRAEGSLLYLSGGAGYSFQLGPESSHWRLMLSAEMGPMRTPYKYYEMNDAGNLFLKRQDTFMWGLPTRLEVSLMYVFYSKNRTF